jgi:hypothetical protein
MKFDVGKESIAVDGAGEIDVVESELQMVAVARIVHGINAVVRLELCLDRGSHHRFRIASRKRLHRLLCGLDVAGRHEFPRPLELLRGIGQERFLRSVRAEAKEFAILVRPGDRTVGHDVLTF